MYGLQRPTRSSKILLWLDVVHGGPRPIWSFAMTRCLELCESMSSPLIPCHIRLLEAANRHHMGWILFPNEISLCLVCFSQHVSQSGLMKRIGFSLQTKSTPETSHRQDIQLWIGRMHKVLYDTQRPEEAHSHTHWGEAISVSMSIDTLALIHPGQQINGTGLLIDIQRQI